ncbi:MAG: metal ABC transporter permease [Deltaproteobacteria bacterium]|nr:metal ABC transporter permease [Deltaproteobacteria bacterium]
MSFLAAYDFWRDSVLAVLLAGALCGYLGVHVLQRRVVFVGAALTQVSGVGVALAFWLSSFGVIPDPHEAGTSFWLSPQFFSLIAAVGGALLFSFPVGGRRVAPDTVVGLGWVISSALLLLILSSKRIVQEAHEVDDLLYGSAVLVDIGQVKILLGVVIAVLAVHLVFFKELLFVSYDEEMAQALGYRTRAWDMLLYATFGVGISFAVRTVGALPAFAFLIIPAASAQLLVKRIQWAFPLSVAFAMAGGALGYYVAFTRELPTGAAIVATSALFLLPGLLRRFFVREE